MGLFSQMPQHRKDDWAGIPSEPDERTAAEKLEETASVDPYALTLGATTTMVFPVAPAAPEAADTTTAAPGPDPEPEPEPETDPS